MKKSNLKKALHDSKIVFGPFLKITDPTVVEIMGFDGFDFASTGYWSSGNRNSSG
ncbi:MAG: hypothetical protein WBF68_03830 [Atribacterota bacterium]